MVLAVVLRAYGLGAQSVWYDECQSVSHLNEPGLFAYLRAERYQDWYMVPLYFTLQYAWVHVFGEAPATIRWLSILFGVASIPLVYAIGRSLFGRTAGLIAALCMALSPAHLFLAQEIRPYSLMNLFVLASAGAFIQLLRTGGRRWWWLHLGANFLLLWTHLFGAFFIVAEGAFILLSRRVRRETIIWGVAHLLLVLPTMWWMSSVNRSFAGKEEPPTAWRIVGNAFGDCMPRNSPAYIPEDQSWENAPPAWTRPLRATFPYFDYALLGVFAACLGWFLWRRARLRGESYGIFLVLWMFLPCLCLFFIARFWRPDAFTARYMSYCPLALYLIVGAALASLPRSAWRYAAIAALMVLYGHRLALTLASPQRTDWLVAKEWILKAGTPEEPVIAYPAGYHFECTYNLRPEKRPVFFAQDLEHVSRLAEESLSRKTPAWVACVGLAGTAELTARLERYFGVRGIPVERKGYWASQLPYLMVYRLAPSDAPVSKDAIAAALREATEGYDAEQARTKATHEAREEGLALLRAGSYEAGWQALEKAFATIPWDEDAYVQMSKTVLESKRGYTHLVSASRAFSAQRPDDPRPYADLGLALAAENNTSEAEPALRKAVQLDPAGQPAAYRTLLDLLRRRNDARGALEVALDAARHVPSESFFPSQAVLLAVEVGDYEAAVAAYESLLQSGQTDSLAFEQLARCLTTKKRDRRKVIDLARRTIAIAPKQARAYAVLGAALMETGQRDEAFDAFRKAVARDPQIDPPMYRAMADVLWERKNYAGVVKMATSGLQYLKDDPALSVRLAEALCKRGKWEKARALVEAAGTPDPAAILFGVVANAMLWDGQDFEGAIAFTRSFIERQPANAGAYAILGMALRHENDIDGAIAALRKSIDLAPEASPWTCGNLASLLLERADASGAAEAARKGIALLATDSFLFDVLGQALCRMGDYAEAAEAARKAAELNPQAGSPPWTLAMALLGLGQRDAAIVAAHRAFEHDGGLAGNYQTLFTAVLEKPDAPGAWQEVQRIQRSNARVPYELMKALEALQK